MALIPGLSVPAPEPLRRRYGLFDAAIGPLDLAPHGEGGGVRYGPVTCGVGYAMGINCADGVVAASDKPIDGDVDEVDTGVFNVLSTFACGAPGYSQAEATDKARRALAATEQGVVEETFWTGEDFAGNVINVLNLEKTAEAIFPPTGGAPRIETVLATLEDYAYRQQGYGFQAYVHAPSLAAPYAAESGLIVQDGQRKLTPNGSVWVFGGGYPGTGAAGASGWPGGGFLHITGQVTVWRAPQVQTYVTFDPPTNQRLVVAERPYAVSYECFNARAEFNPMNLS
jgi:hypothetical protein